MGLGEGRRIEAAQVLPPVHFAAHQARGLERLDVLGGRRERHVVRLGELAHGAFSMRELPEHPAAGGVSQGAEDGVEVRVCMFNHKVECRRVRGECQPLG